MSKTLFNDPKPQMITARVECCGCRASLFIRWWRYPHAPDKITTCPICKQDEAGITVTVLENSV